MVWLYVVLFFALFLRTYYLHLFPFGFTPDEASFAYDAYSIMLTGKDQWGKTLPLVLESFGDFKAPLLAYLTIPFVYFLDLTKIAVRLPNAILSTLAVAVVYFLAGELGKLGKLEAKTIKKFQILSAVFLAISPWHIMMSRGGFEANLTTFFLPAGVLFFLKGIKEKKFMYGAALMFGLNMFTYHSAKLVTPVIVFVLILLFWPEVKKRFNFKTYIPAFFVFSLFLLLSIFTLIQGAATRAQEINISRGAAESSADDRLTAIMAGVPYGLAKTYHNKYTETARRFIDNYTQYTSYRFLFTHGPAEATYGMMPGRGVLYSVEIVFLLFSLYAFSLFKNKRPLVLLILWLLLAPVPASLTFGTGFAANRAAVMMPSIQMISALGVVGLFVWSGRFATRLYKPLKFIVIAVLAVSVFSFLKDYFLISPFKSAGAMLYGNLEAAYTLSQITREGEIVVSRKLSEPHIYFAFAEKIDPQIYQKQALEWNYRERGVNWVDQIPEYKLGRYLFKNIDWNEDSGGSTLMLGRPDEFPLSVEPAMIISYPNGEAALYVVDFNIKSYARKID
jgi:4-amino-4-deoxy-L-arabinose transferase-like glycosyltransferase